MFGSLNQEFGTCELALLAASGELDAPRRNRQPDRSRRRRGRRSDRRH
jgi:hypothetical protein